MQQRNWPGRTECHKLSGLGHLKRHGELDLATAAGLLRRSQSETTEVVAGMVPDGLLERKEQMPTVEATAVPAAAKELAPPPHSGPEFLSVRS